MGTFELSVFKGMECMRRRAVLRESSHSMIYCSRFCLLVQLQNVLPGKGHELYIPFNLMALSDFCLVNRDLGRGVDRDMLEARAHSVDMDVNIHLSRISANAGVSLLPASFRSPSVIQNTLRSHRA